MSSTYGRGVAETIVENCGNTLILRCSASEHGGTSEFASKLIGQREVMHITVSKTRAAGEWFSSKTTGEHLRIEPAIMASEIERLPDLAGFLKLASIPDWQSVTLVPGPGAVPVRPRRPSILVKTPLVSPAVTPAVAIAAAHAPASHAKPKRGRPPKASRPPPTPAAERPHSQAE